MSALGVGEMIAGVIGPTTGLSPNMVGALTIGATVGLSEIAASLLTDLV
jgi:hypothetical protein